jgi:hypothetical protein
MSFKRKSNDDVFASSAIERVLPKKTLRLADVLNIPGFTEEHLVHYFTEWEIFAMTMVTNKDIGKNYNKSDRGLSILSHWFKDNKICCVCHEPTRYVFDVKTTELGLYCHKLCLPPSSRAYVDAPGVQKEMGLWCTYDTSVKLQAGVPMVYLYSTDNPCCIEPRATKQGYNRYKYPGSYEVMDKARVDIEIKRKCDFIKRTLKQLEFFRLYVTKGHLIRIGAFYIERYEYFKAVYPKHLENWTVPQMGMMYQAVVSSLFDVHLYTTMHFQYKTRPSIRAFVRPPLFRTWTSFLRHTVLIQRNISFIDLLVENRCHEDPERLCHLIDDMVANCPEIVAARENHSVV